MLEISHLTKAFSGRTVVDDLSLAVPRGEVLGFLGPNGAGKSTTMRMIAGMIEPDSGDIRLAGQSLLLDRRAAQAALGYLPEGAPLYLDMTTREFLGFLADVRGLRGERRRALTERAVEGAAIGDVLGTVTGTLSKGYRRRVALAGAILHDPQVLVMDEPTDGLDPNQKRAVHALVKTLAAEDKAVLISTHTLEEVETMCHRAVIVNRGKIVATNTPRGFLEAHPGKSFAEIFARLTSAHEDVAA